MRRRSLRNCRIHERPRPNGRRSADHTLDCRKDDTESSVSRRNLCVQSRTVAKARVDDVDNPPGTRKGTAHFDQEDLLQQLGGVVSILHVEVLGIVEGREDGVLLLLFEHRPFGGFGTDDGDGARPGAGAIFLVHDGEELDSEESSREIVDLHDFFVAGHLVDFQLRFEDSGVQNGKIKSRKRSAPLCELADALIVAHVEVPDFDLGPRSLAGEFDAGIVTFFLAPDREDQVAQAKFEELAGSFETETDIGAGDDAGLAA